MRCICSNEFIFFVFYLACETLHYQDYKTKIAEAKRYCLKQRVSYNLLIIIIFIYFNEYTEALSFRSIISLVDFSQPLLSYPGVDNRSQIGFLSPNPTSYLNSEGFIRRTSQLLCTFHTILHGWRSG